tara:strand:- start:11318 stop:12073 length:756 start_codon:yes stop_codon:yes gene_type:complete
MATETVNINPEENNPSLEEQAALQDEVQSPSGDQKILGKFESYEELEKAYATLQSEYTKSRQLAESESVSDNNAEASEEVAREAVEQVGLDFEALSNEFWSNDGLADESYAQLEQAGIPRELVDSYIEGQQALLSTTETQVYDSVGGEESYRSMTGWAEENLSDGQIDAFNEAVNSGDMEKTMFAVQGLKSMYDAQQGTEPARQLAGQARASVDSYQSLAQMKADMADPRYQSDSAFREAVAQKLGRSNIM